MLSSSLKTGKSAFEQVYQTDIFSYFRQHPEQSILFSRFMEQTTQTWLAEAEVEKYYYFSGHLIDIGGNTGALSGLLLQQFPELKATVFDLKQAMIGAETVLSTAGVSNRCHLKSGSFFEPETIPKDGDIYLISRVLLNWNDEKAVEILKNCRQVMPTQSKLLILDFILPDFASTSELLASLNLWVMFNARFRKQAEFKQLVEQAGFRSLRWIDIDGMKFFLEASPV
jgi:ubiquinone/menaquinone biosynthesis C-methylase UbiE